MSLPLDPTGRRQVVDTQREGRLRAGLAVLGALLTAGIWAFDSELVATILRVLSLGSSFDVLLRPGVRLVGTAVVPSIYSSARPEPDRSPICRDYACMISSFVRARPWARPQTQTLSC